MNDLAPDEAMARIRALWEAHWECERLKKEWHEARSRADELHRNYADKQRELLQLTTPPEPMPLYDGVPANGQAAAGEPPAVETPPEAEKPSGLTWRERPLSVLNLTPRIMSVLEKAGIKTLGDLNEQCERPASPPYKIMCTLPTLNNGQAAHVARSFAQYAHRHELIQEVATPTGGNYAESH